jgi:hypothetical protein
MRFDARVIGIPDHLAQVRKSLTRHELMLEQAKFRAAEDTLAERMTEQGLELQELFRRRKECVSHFRCDRVDFLAPLQDFACFVDGTSVQEVTRDNAWTNSLHLVLMGQADSLLLPVDFGVPVHVPVNGRPHRYVVCSAARMQRELDTLDQYVAVQFTLGVRAFDAFVDISRGDMERFERREGVGRRFWAKWGLAAMRGLVERSLSSQVPVIVDPSFSRMPAVT